MCLNKFFNVVFVCVCVYEVYFKQAEHHDENNS